MKRLLNSIYPMQYIQAEETEYPICPFCEQQLREVKFKNLMGAGGFWIPNKKIIFFCPHCKKVLGNSDADTG